MYHFSGNAAKKRRSLLPQVPPVGKVLNSIPFRTIAALVFIRSVPCGLKMLPYP